VTTTDPSIRRLGHTFTALALVVGCSSDAGSAQPDAAALDAVDAAVDESSDVGTDAAEVGTDAGLDVPRDVPVDRGVDVPGVDVPDVPLACDGGLVACRAACVDPRTSPAHCGGCDHPCAAPAHAVAACTDGACGFTCEATYQRAADACVRIDPPRLVAPLTTALATSRRPRLRWALAAGTDGAVVDRCSDRACTSVLASYEATGASVVVPADLPTGAVFWRARGRSGTTAGTVASPVWSFAVGARSAAVDTSWGTAFDADGDGQGDLAVGVPSLAMSTGGARVYAGTPSGYAASPAATLGGRDGVNAVFGGALAPAGDVNGDGFVELAVGAYRAASGAGRVYLFAGGAGGLGSSPIVTLNGRDGADADFGFAVAPAGDVNGDGYADLIVGAPTALSLVGRAYVFLGGAAGLATTPAAAWTSPDGRGSNFGLVVAGAGDVNGDGFADVLVAAPGAMTATGRVYLYLGGAAGLPAAATAVLTGPDGTLSDFGGAVACAGDVNGDGYADVAVGADRVGSFAGRVYLYLGGAAGLAATPAAVLPGNGNDTHLGAALAGSDLDGDGYADLAVTSYNPTTGGRVRVFTGGASGLVTTGPAVITAPDGMSSGFGSALRGAGDVTGDGLADLVVGASQAESGRGRVYLFPGRGGLIASAPASTVTGADAAGSGFGSALGAAGGR
jgi:hypothetical protein